MQTTSGDTPKVARYDKGENYELFWFGESFVSRLRLHIMPKRIICQGVFVIFFKFFYKFRKFLYKNIKNF